MIIHSKSSSRQPQGLLAKAQSMRQNVRALADELKQLDNQPGIDSDLASGSLKFADRLIDSDGIQGHFSGSLQMENGEVKEFRLFGPDGRCAAGYLAKESRAWAPVEGGGSLSISQDHTQQTRVTTTEHVDPNTKSFRFKHLLSNCADVVGAALGTAVPVLGLGFFSLSRFLDDSRQGMQGLTLASHVVGAGALILGCVAASPALLGLAGLGLGGSALTAGVLAAGDTYGPPTEAFEQMTSYEFATH